MPVEEAKPAHPTEALWHEFRARLNGFIAPRVRQPADAEDILQEVFLRIHRKVGSLKDPNALTGWVFQITRNAIVDHYRSERRNETSITKDIDKEFIPQHVTEKEHLEFSRCLHPMVQDLPAPYREALILTELEGLSQKEAAERIAISLPGMKSRVQRARRQLKELFLACCEVEMAHNGGLMDCSVRTPGGPLCDGCSEPDSNKP